MVSLLPGDRSRARAKRRCHTRRWVRRPEALRAGADSRAVWLTYVALAGVPGAAAHCHTHSRPHSMPHTRPLPAWQQRWAETVSDRLSHLPVMDSVGSCLGGRRASSNPPPCTRSLLSRAPSALARGARVRRRLMIQKKAPGSNWRAPRSCFGAVAQPLTRLPPYVFPASPPPPRISCAVWLHHTVHFVSFPVPACPPRQPTQRHGVRAHRHGGTTNVAGALLLLAALSTGQSFLNAHLRTLGVPAHKVCPTRAPRPACR